MYGGFKAAFRPRPVYLHNRAEAWIPAGRFPPQAVMDVDIDRRNTFGRSIFGLNGPDLSWNESANRVF